MSHLREEKKMNKTQNIFIGQYGAIFVNEYSEELDVEEFIEMSLSWGEDDGWDLETYYKENPTHRSPYGKPERYVDGLRISDSVDFS